MSSQHTIHEDIQTHGLADGCPRCEEHAYNPWRDLDDTVLRDLVERATQANRFDLMRSDTEGIAMAKIVDAIDHIGILMSAAPADVVEDLVNRWRAPIEYTG